MKTVKPERRALNNEQHFGCMSDTKILIESVGADQLGLETLFPIFKNLFIQEDQAMEFFRKSGITSTIMEMDSLRDTVYRGLRLLVEGFSHSRELEEKQAASNIQFVIDQYGDFRQQDYNQESASIFNFVQDLAERCSADLAKLNLTRWVTDLNEINEEFKALMAKRYDEQAAKAGIKLRDIRNQIDKVYTQMMNTIEALSFINPDDATLNDFITRLNARLTDYKKMIALRQTVLGKKQEEK